MHHHFPVILAYLLLFLGLAVALTPYKRPRRRHGPRHASKFGYGPDD